MAFFPCFPNPICSNKRLKGKENGDPAGQGGRNNNTYPWATFQHMQPFYIVLKLFTQTKGSQANVGSIEKKIIIKKKYIRPKG